MLRMLRMVAQVALVNELQAILGGGFVVHGAPAGHTGLRVRLGVRGGSGPRFQC